MPRYHNFMCFAHALPQRAAALEPLLEAEPLPILSSVGVNGLFLVSDISSLNSSVSIAAHPYAGRTIISVD